jgi:hypothetical protein
VNEDWTRTRAERIQIHFVGFMWKGTRYPSVAIIDVLGPAYEQASKVTVDLGNELTQLLRPSAVRRAGSGAILRHERRLTMRKPSNAKRLPCSPSGEMVTDSFGSKTAVAACSGH